MPHAWIFIREHHSTYIWSLLLLLRMNERERAWSRKDLSGGNNTKWRGGCGRPRHSYCFCCCKSRCKLCLSTIRHMTSLIRTKLACIFQALLYGKARKWEKRVKFLECRFSSPWCACVHQGGWIAEDVQKRGYFVYKLDRYRSLNTVSVSTCRALCWSRLCAFRKYSTAAALAVQS